MFYGITFIVLRLCRLRMTPVLVRVEAGYLSIRTASLACHWQENLSKVIEVPLDARLIDLFGLRLKRTNEQIARSGLTERVGDAERRMHELIEQAAILLKPFGVEHMDVLQLVEEVLARKA